MNSAYPDHWRVPLTKTGLLAASGKDAAKFLQGQATCDVLRLPENRSTLGAFCTAKGRVVALFRAFRADDAYFLSLPSELLETVRKRLSLYVLRSDARIEDASARFAAFGAGGPAILAKLGLPETMEENESSVRDGWIALRVPSAGPPRLMILARAERAEECARMLEAADCAPADEALWRLEDIRAGLPTVQAATSEAFLPQVLNLDRLGGIALDKGCYTGQEIVARTHYLGHLKRRMFRFAGVEGPAPKPGDAIRADAVDGQGAGQTVNAAPTPEGGFELLAVANLALAENEAVRWSVPASDHAFPLTLVR
jgi:folate-binding protein YgfZ